MAQAERISEENIPQYLAKHPKWQRSGNAITQHFQFANFLAAMGFANAVAICAEAAQHHPDIQVFSWNKVKISIVTHGQGGLTASDFALAAKIDAIQG